MYEKKYSGLYLIRDVIHMFKPVANTTTTYKVDMNIVKRWSQCVSFKSIREQISQGELNQIERFADRLFAKVGIDVEFTRHFIDRVNDARNKKDITPAELTRLFKQTYNKHEKKILQRFQMQKQF